MKRGGCGRGWRRSRPSHRDAGRVATSRRNAALGSLTHINVPVASLRHTCRMMHERENIRTRALSSLRAAASWLTAGALVVAWLSAPGLALPATHSGAPAPYGLGIVQSIQSYGDPGDWCPPGMSLCDASVCCKKGWRCCRGACCPPQYRWHCETKGKCYRSKQAALRAGCPAYAVSICIKPRWAD